MEETVLVAMNLTRNVVDTQTMSPFKDTEIGVLRTEVGASLVTQGEIRKWLEAGKDRLAVTREGYLPTAQNVYVEPEQWLPEQ